MQNRLVALHQFDGSVKLLKVDLAAGKRWLVPVGNVEGKELAFGMFEVEKVEPELESVALLATPDGPLLLLKDLQYRPNVQKTRITVTDDATLAHFLVEDDGRPIFGLFYEKKFGAGLHPYLKEREDFDFYYWLSKNINNSRLYQIYTREIKFLDPNSPNL